ncbi:acetate--CoA ligase family protein [Primorskyibacter aestuariivivens]|uniref:acetate--CoA ligase family protein n=1 Tax=Primorskyibacter aestuariivivens TaxID=1888912 RepID=UPI0023014E27|nr:acetate--CoA ligase family protein [Primorskyibacter aestuariivivens]MDA7430826.1 acetate--CoA ligase family protein [Primorskyibacter aestuariivivens]
MASRLSRLFKPRSIAVIGGGFWSTNVIEECRKIGFDGPVYPVHPLRPEIAGCATNSDLHALPQVPDATFIGVNREATIELVATLSAMGAGGAVCFASGFREASAELADGDALQTRLLAAAGAMPILGPNCYGFINALDRAALWPDQHGAQLCETGVALITQSSNIAINLTMVGRALPLAYVVTAGNQASVSLPEIGAALLDDPRVTALGLHIEGISDLSGFHALARQAQPLGKPIVALKVGSSEQAQQAAISHTASLAGSATGARALFERLGIAQVESLPQLLETLRLAHATGTLPSAEIACASCSGGEASLAADTALRHGVRFPPLSDTQRAALAKALGPRVALANPLDYHTYIWGDVAAMTATFTVLAQGDHALTCIIVDFPRPDRCDPSAWTCVIDAASAARAATGKPIALLASLPELQSDEITAQIFEAGLIPLGGIDDAFAAIGALARPADDGLAQEADPLCPRMPRNPQPLTEAESKTLLARHGLHIPQSRRATGKIGLAKAAREIGPPLVIKAEGMAHKSEHGGVILASDAIGDALSGALAMPTETWLVEEMVTDAVAELLVGVTCDPAHGHVLTLGAGGVLTELHRDAVHLLVPASHEAVEAALDQLRLAPLLRGYRGRPAADIPAIVAAVAAVQDTVVAHHGRVAEVEINPLICTPHSAIAADALITIGDAND